MDESAIGALCTQLSAGLPSPEPGCRLIVTIPAKDEAGFIRRSLSALHGQTAIGGGVLDFSCFEVFLLANNCTDDTADVARDFAVRHPRLRLHVIPVHFSAEHAGVGLARRVMMDMASTRLGAGGIIAMTDADTLADPYWIAATLRAFDRGARAVGGRIVVPASDRRGYRKTHLQDVTYRSLVSLLESVVDPDPGDPWPRHFQHYGPSLAVTKEMYMACGGMPPIRSIEDAAFAWALERIDVTFVHDLAVRVYTSDRDSDRIEGVAFSESLREWTRMSEADRHAVVFGLQHCVDLCKWKVALRHAFAERRVSGFPALGKLCELLEIELLELQSWVTAAPTFGSLYLDVRQRVERCPSFSDTSYSRAIADLRRFTSGTRGSLLSSTHPCGSGRSVPLESGSSYSAVG